MPSHELSRICRDLSQLGETLEIACTKNGVEFRTEGDIGTGKVHLKQTTNADKEEDNVSDDWKAQGVTLHMTGYTPAYTKRLYFLLLIAL